MFTVLCVWYLWFASMALGASPSPETLPGVSSELAREVERAIAGCKRSRRADCTWLGIELQRGNVVAEDPVTGLKLLEASCRRGDQRACARVATAHLMGLGVAENAARAGFLAKKACQQGASEGCALVAYMQEKGKGTAKDPRAAWLGYQRACDDGIEWACSSYGYGLETGQVGVRPELAEARRYYSKACAMGSGRGCTNLGWLSEQGRGGSKDLSAAAKLYEQACGLGYARGCTNLGVMVEHGRGVPASADRAVALYELGCVRQDNRSCTSLAWSLTDGEARLRDLPRAVALLTQACDADYPRACNNLGVQVARGNVSGVQPSGAIQYYERGCALGNGKACDNLGDAYREGKLARADDARAFAAYTEGCILEFPSSCASVGYHLSQGRGTTRNLSEARTVYDFACDHEVGWACTNLGRMLRDGEGGSKSTIAGVELLERGCALKNAGGCYSAGLAWRDGLSGRPDLARAADHFERGCAMEHGWSCYRLGQALDMGAGVERNDGQAQRRYRQACAADVSDACGALETASRRKRAGEAEGSTKDYPDEERDKDVAWDRRPVHIYARAGALGHAWWPSPVEGVSFSGRTYTSTYIQGRAELWDTVVFRRVRWESSGGAGQSEVGTDGAQIASDLELPPIAGRLFDLVGSVNVSGDPDERHGPAMRFRSSTFRFRSTTEQPKRFIDINAGQTTFTQIEAQQTLAMPVSFREGFVGYGYGEGDRYERWDAAIGLAYLRFSRPWSPILQGSQPLILSPLDAYGVGVIWDGQYIPAGGGWFLNRLVLEGSGEGRWGLGQTRLKGTEAESVFPEGTLFVSNLHVAGEGHANLDVLKGRPGALGVGAHVGLSMDTFNAETKGYLASLLVSTAVNALLGGSGVSASANRSSEDYLTFDYRVFGGLEVRGKL